MKFPTYKQFLLGCALSFLSSSLVSAEESSCRSIVEIACEIEELSIMCGLITSSETVTDYLTNLEFTLFAPIDGAFDNIGEEEFNEMVQCGESLNNLFAFHTVFGQSVYSTDLVCKETIEMSIGDDSRTVCRGDKMHQKGSLNSREQMPEIVTKDIEACNGVVHLVNQVMLPKQKYLDVCEGEELLPMFPSRPVAPVEDLATEDASAEDIIMDEPLFDDNITDDDFEFEESLSDDNVTGIIDEIEETVTESVILKADETSPLDMGCSVANVICSDNSFTILCDLMSEFEVGGFTYYELLDGRVATGDWTIFAPIDEAFYAIEESSELSLTDLSMEALMDIVSFHAVQFQILTYDDLICKETIKMSNGDDSRTKCDKDDETGERFKIQKGAGQLDGMLPRLIMPNIEACNGIIHKIDNVMLPKL